ncbi:aminotransferase class I/II-fold pyridoxal phosphate-dependent enzyme [Acidimicrobiales bacterium]|nr:aminotransferase class I/II-fold pyridoxal phosphate-dependent enzyme [Acidimicrobiales bacterium]
MTAYSFLDDYSEGCHPEILDLLTTSNMTQQTAYGNDVYTLEARRLIAERCGRADVPVHFVGGGTLANLTICAAVLRSHEAIISPTSGHIAMRETGAIEATGHKIISMPHVDGKLTPDAIEEAVAGNSQGPHMAKPRMVYISNATEFGTVYALDELKALRKTCDVHDLLLLIDGARLGAALGSDHATGTTLADVARLADIFWIGGTKAGTLFGEAIVIPNSSLADDFDFHIKQRGALLAKGRSLGVQFQALFSDDLFERSAVSANAAAQTLAAGVVSAGFELAAETESNQVFALLPNPVIEVLQQSFSFYVWEPRTEDHSVIRLVTSWATDAVQVDRFVELIMASR